MGATTFSLLRKRQAEAEAKIETQPESPATESEPSPSWRLFDKGGGWHQIYRGSDLVEQVRGAEAAEERLEELRKGE